MEHPSLHRISVEDTLQLLRSDVLSSTVHPLYAQEIPRVSELNVTRDIDSLASYPPPWSLLVENAYCQYLQMHCDLELGIDRFLATRGSIEGIELVIRAFCSPGVDSIAIAGPTFPEYERLAKINGIRIVNVPLQGQNLDRLDVDGIVQSGCKMLFLCNPGNPSGTTLDSADVNSAIQRFRGIIVVDEAYAELAGENFGSAILVQDREAKVLVLRSFSKGWSMAGARLGLIIAHKLVIRELRKLIHPFAISVPVLNEFAKRLDSCATVRHNCDEIVRRRNEMIVQLSDFACVEKVFLSSTNFVTIVVRDFPRVFGELASHSCLVTDCTRSIEGAIKLTIGSCADVAMILTILERHNGEDRV